MNSAPVQKSNTLRKLLIPVLLLVLLGVLILPGKKAASAPPVPAAHSTSTAVSPATPHFTRTVDQASERPVAASPLTYCLSDALALNPFDPPQIPKLTALATIPLPPEVEQVSQLATLADPAPALAPKTSVALQAIFFNQQGAAAIIEDRILRVGDPLPDGRQIVRITRRGIELTP